MDRMFTDAETPENPQRGGGAYEDPFDDLLNDPYATYSADEQDDRTALEAIARDGAGSTSRLPATLADVRPPEISSSRWLQADEAEQAWRTGTMRAITHKPRAVRPRNRPLPPPRRFRRRSPVPSGILLVVTLVLVIAASVGALDLSRKAYNAYEQSRSHATATPVVHPHTTPTVTVTPHH